MRLGTLSEIIESFSLLKEKLSLTPETSATSLRDKLNSLPIPKIDAAVSAIKRLDAAIESLRSTEFIVN